MVASLTANVCITHHAALNATATPMSSSVAYGQVQCIPSHTVYTSLGPSQRYRTSVSQDSPLVAGEWNNTYMYAVQEQQFWHTV